MTIRSNFKKMPCTSSKYNFRRVLNDQEKNKGSSYSPWMFRINEEVTSYGDFIQSLGRNVLPSIAKEPANSYTAIGRLSD